MECSTHWYGLFSHSYITQPISYRIVHMTSVVVCYTLSSLITACEIWANGAILDDEIAMLIWWPMRKLFLLTSCLCLRHFRTPTHTPSHFVLCSIWLSFVIFVVLAALPLHLGVVMRKLAWAQNMETDGVLGFSYGWVLLCYVKMLC